MARRNREPHFLSSYGHLAKGGYSAEKMPTPAVGTNLSYRIGGEAIERIHSCFFKFVASGVVANRNIGISITDSDGKIVWGAYNATNFSAGETALVTLTDQIAQPSITIALTAFRSVWIALPTFMLLPGWNISTDIQGLDGGDQISQVQAVREQFFTGQDGYPIGAEGAASYESFREHFHQWVIDVYESRR